MSTTQAQIDPAADAMDAHFDLILKAYLSCALWAETDDSDDDGGLPLDDSYTIDDIADKAELRAIEDCELFMKRAGDLLNGLEPDAIGHDFWLSRNGHGAGFFDRGLGERGDKLQDIAETFNSCDIYAGDDGLLYVL